MAGIDGMYLREYNEYEYLNSSLAIYDHKLFKESYYEFIVV